MNRAYSRFDILSGVALLFLIFGGVRAFAGCSGGGYLTNEWRSVAAEMATDGATTTTVLDRILRANGVGSLDDLDLIRGHIAEPDTSSARSWAKAILADGDKRAPGYLGAAMCVLDAATSNSAGGMMVARFTPIEAWDAADRIDDMVKRGLPDYKGKAYVDPEYLAGLSGCDMTSEAIRALRSSVWRKNVEGLPDARLARPGLGLRIYLDQTGDTTMARALWASGRPLAVNNLMETLRFCRVESPLCEVTAEITSEVLTRCESTDKPEIPPYFDELLRYQCTQWDMDAVMARIFISGRLRYSSLDTLTLKYEYLRRIGGSPISHDIIRGRSGLILFDQFDDVNTLRSHFGV